MIVVTTGTNEWAFDRLVRAAAALGGDEELFVQYGSSSEPHGRGEWVDFLPFDELEERMRTARVVVSHAGIGSIMLARRCGQRPIVVPRLGRLGEAVDDHQLHCGRQLQRAGLVTLVEDERQLQAAISGLSVETPEVARTTAMAGAAALTADLQACLKGLGVRPNLNHQVGPARGTGTTVLAS
jgi:UDP-N-acetylglucosamine transferase subunit ALG13